MTGKLHDGPDFLRIIKYVSVLPKMPLTPSHGYHNGKRPFFTYAIIEEDNKVFKMKFSETGASFFKDFFSKHAMHAGAKEEVVYSGEFHIQKDSKGHHWLVIDNNRYLHSKLTS